MANHLVNPQFLFSEVFRMSHDISPYSRINTEVWTRFMMLSLGLLCFPTCDDFLCLWWTRDLTTVYPPCGHWWMSLVALLRERLFSCCVLVCSLGWFLVNSSIVHPPVGTQCVTVCVLRGYIVPVIGSLSPAVSLQKRAGDNVEVRKAAEKRGWKDVKEGLKELKPAGNVGIIFKDAAVTLIWGSRRRLW